MIAVWKYSLETEAQRLLHCAHQIVIGFYRVNNFIVLPYTPKAGNALIVTFPDLPYNTIPRFWDRVKKINIDDFPLQIKSNLLRQTTTLLKNANLPAPDLQKTKKLWEKAGDKILNEIYRIMPAKRDRIKKIVIHPTSFGTTCSFNLSKKGVDYVEMYLRQDQGISTIAEAILTSLIRPDIYEKLGGVWQESEIVADWLLTQSSLAGVIRKYEKKSNFVPTIKGTRIKQQARLISESDKFYKKLGLPAQTKVFNLNGLTPEIHKRPIENLNPKEKILLRELIQKENTILTFDEIADSLSQNEEQFSLWALAKLVERLRTKLEENGLSGSYIQTLRGQGYILKN